MVIVQTVLGPVDPKVVGRTLTHEHLFLNFEDHFHVPPPIDLEAFLNKKITLGNVGFVKHFPYSCRYNLEFFDVESQNAVRKDLELFKKLGGGAIVENTSYGLHRNLEFLYEVSKSTEVHVIAGTGHYIEAKQHPKSLALKLEEMSDLYRKEIITGCELIGGEIVKCGFIGEVGSSWPITDFEKRAILATGEIQEVLGCGVSFHPGLNTKAPFEIIRLYLEAGGKADKCVMSHLDLIPFDLDGLLEFSKLGTYLQYDHFGMESSYFQFDPELDMLSDAQRINNLLKLISEGKEDKILISHDVHSKHRLTSFGGHGYSHIQTNILPRLYGKGLSLDQVDKITVQNPANWLSFSI